MRLSETVLVALYISGHVAAYGDMGHRTVALLARKYLTDDAKTYFDDILANPNGYEWDDAATWADVVRPYRPYTDTWHYINGKGVGEKKDTAPKGCTLVHPKDCDAQKTGCVISAITNHTSQVLDSSQELLVRREALMFLMHFMGDIHQPLHTEAAFRGGTRFYIPNKITGMRDGSNNSVEKVYAAEWADKLFSLNAQSGVSATAECADVTDPDKCVIKWARESNKWICKYVLQPDVDYLESNDLSLDYFEGAAPIVEELVGKAGARLGAWLNAIYASVESNAAGKANSDQHPILAGVRQEV